jgi:hypothetical protein
MLEPNHILQFMMEALRMRKHFRQDGGLLCLCLFALGLTAHSLGASSKNRKAEANLVTPYVVGHFRSPDKKYSVREIHDDGDTTTIVVIEAQTSRELVTAADVQSFDWVPGSPHRLVVGASGLYGEGMLAMWEGGTDWHYLVRARHPADESFTVWNISRDGRFITYTHQQDDNWVITGKEPRHRLRLPLRRTLLAGALPSGATVATSRVKSPRTVVDYYMLLPQRYFEIDRRSLLNPKYGAIVDVKNGYLRPWHDGAQIGWEMCLFKRLDGSYLFAVSWHEGPDDGWDPSLDFFSYQNGRLVDVTRSTLPQRFSEKLGYELPRYGTTIRVVTESGKQVYDLVWTRERFQIRRKSHRT